MSNSPAPIDLTDAEKRDLIALIQAGNPLPETYRFLLFEDKREVELVWNGKTRDVCTTVLPVQTLEHVDEPRAEAAASPQAELFDARGRQTKGWSNKPVWGDNKRVLSSLKSGPAARANRGAGGLKLIYIDPRSTSAPISRWTSRSAARPFTRSRTSWSRSGFGPVPLVFRPVGGGRVDHLAP